VKRSVGFEKIGMTILLAMLFVAVKQALRFLCVFGLLMVAGSAFAQNTILRANVPFSFKVNKETLPAGQYEVRTISSGGSHVLLINNRAAKTGEVFPTHAVIASHAQADKAKLVFKRYGDQYFLSQIWLDDSVTGRELPQNARERELVASYAPARVVVMADLR